jgi:hypothetical protein
MMKVTLKRHPGNARGYLEVLNLAREYLDLEFNLNWLELNIPDDVAHEKVIRFLKLAEGLGCQVHVK